MARFTMATSSRKRRAVSARGRRSISKFFSMTLMKCAFTKEDSGNPVSPGSIRMTVGPS